MSGGLNINKISVYDIYLAKEIYAAVYPTLIPIKGIEMIVGFWSRKSYKITTSHFV
jgi:hypothetical protein